jgi:hypothetical protein
MKYLPGMIQFIAQFEEFGFGANADSALQTLPGSFKLCISLVEHLFQAHAPRAPHTQNSLPWQAEQFGRQGRQCCKAPTAKSRHPRG